MVGAMNKTNQKPATIDERYRTLFILWAGLTMSLVLYLAFIQFVPVAAKPNARLTLLLNTAGLIPVGASFLIKQVLIGKAIQSQRVEQVHSAYIISWALCEVAGLLGLFDNRATGSSYYFIGFAIAGVGLLAHFPRKQPLLDASQTRL
jgi:hypothetical protein